MRKSSESIIVQNVCIMQAELIRRPVAWKRCDSGISGGEQKEQNCTCTETSEDGEQYS